MEKNDFLFLIPKQDFVGLLLIQKFGKLVPWKGVKVLDPVGRWLTEFFALKSKNLRKRGIKILGDRREAIVKIAKKYMKILPFSNNINIKEHECSIVHKILYSNERIFLLLSLHWKHRLCQKPGEYFISRYRAPHFQSI